MLENQIVVQEATILCKNDNNIKNFLATYIISHLRHHAGLLLVVIHQNPINRRLTICRYDLRALIMQISSYHEAMIRVSKEKN